MAKWSRVLEEMGCNESIRAHGSAELEVLSRFLNQIKPLSETDHLLGLNKCLPMLEQKKDWKIQRVPIDIYTYIKILGHLTYES